MSVEFKKLINDLEDKKGLFITRCGREVESYVVKKGADALSLWVGPLRYDTKNIKFFAIVSKFAFGNSKTYKGQPIRSVLEEPLSQKVASIYGEFIDENRPRIEAEFGEALRKNVDFQKTIAKVIGDEIAKRGGKLVRHQVSDLVSQALHSSIAAQISQSASVAIGTGVGASIINALGPALVHVLQLAVAKAVASAAMHKIIGAIVAHSVAAMIGATMVAALAHSIGAATASSVLGPAAWLAGGGYALYKILTLPKTLGRKLGQAVQDQLNLNFTKWTGEAFGKAFEELLDPGKWTTGFVNELADHNIFEMIDDAFDHPMGDEDYESKYKQGAELLAKGNAARKDVAKWKR